MKLADRSYALHTGKLLEAIWQRVVVADIVFLT